MYKSITKFKKARNVVSCQWSKSEWLRKQFKIFNTKFLMVKTLHVTICV